MKLTLQVRRQRPRVFLILAYFIRQVVLSRINLGVVGWEEGLFSLDHIPS